MSEQEKPIETPDSEKDRVLLWLKLLNLFLLALMAVGLGFFIGGIYSLYKG